MKANPDTDNARRHKSAKHPLLLSLIFLNSKPRLLTSYGKKKGSMSGPSFTSPLEQQLPQGTKNLSNLGKITQTLVNGKSLPPFINRKIQNTKPQQQKKRKKKKRKQQKQHTYFPSRRNQERMFPLLLRSIGFKNKIKIR